MNAEQINRDENPLILYERTSSKTYVLIKDVINVIFLQKSLISGNAGCVVQRNSVKN